MQIALFQNIRQEILNELDKAQSQIKVAVAWFTNYDLFEKLCEKVSKGVSVELIVIDDYINNGDWGLNFQHFINIGGRLYYGKEDNPMHHKFCIIDNSILFNGSYNWTYYAESRNVENTIKFINNFPINQQFLGEFERLKMTLKPATIAIKRQVTEIELFNFFSVKNYLANDLLYQGKQRKEIKFVEAATRILPNNQTIKTEYQKLSQEILIKKTIISLGISSRINGVDNQFSILVPKGTVVPINQSGFYYTVYDNQSSILVHTYKGENSNVQFNISIGSFTIADLPLKPANQAGVEVNFSMTKEGVLTVKARSLDTGNQIESTYYLENLIH